MRLVMIAFLVLPALSACEGESRETTYTDYWADAAPDSGTIGDRCNPLSQAGCDLGEKCGQLVESDDPFLVRTACVPDGTESEGASCNLGAAAATGFDDCVAGLDCYEGLCRRICDTDSPDSCRDPGESFGAGAYCTSFRNLFFDHVGLCMPACDPNRDLVVANTVVSADCRSGAGCYLDAVLGTTTCQETLVLAGGATQNQDCFAYANGICLANGCASGFAPMLDNKPENADAKLCARYCSPAPTHSNAPSAAAGLNGNCSSSALGEIGGTNGELSEHQCRFVQSFNESAAQVPEQVGMCVPVNPSVGGSWSDCTAFDWDGIKLVWADAIAAGGDPQLAFDNHCLVDPNGPALKDSCVGLLRGCISSQEKAEGLPLTSSAP